jgi:hypothetical protein
MQLSMTTVNLVVTATERQARMVCDGLDGTFPGHNFRPAVNGSISWRVELMVKGEPDEQINMFAAFARGFYACLKAHCSM